MKKQVNVTIDELRIEILNKCHKLDDFRTYEQELEDFLKNDALQNQQLHLSVTFLWFYEKRLVGYITLLNDTIKLERKLRKLFISKGVHYKSLPALKIGRLCVHDDFLRRGIGRLMIIFAIDQAKDIAKNQAGCRFITLDAKRNMDKDLDATHFYRRLGFDILKATRRDTTPMCLDIISPDNIKFGSACLFN